MLWWNKGQHLWKECLILLVAINSILWMESWQFLNTFFHSCILRPKKINIVGYRDAYMKNKTLHNRPIETLLSISLSFYFILRTWPFHTTTAKQTWTQGKRKTKIMRSKTKHFKRKEQRMTHSSICVSSTPKDNVVFQKGTNLLICHYLHKKDTLGILMSLCC